MLERLLIAHGQTKVENRPTQWNQLNHIFLVSSKINY